MRRSEGLTTDTGREEREENKYKSAETNQAYMRRRKEILVRTSIEKREKINKDRNRSDTYEPKRSDSDRI